MLTYTIIFELKTRLKNTIVLLNIFEKFLRNVLNKNQCDQFVKQHFKYNAKNYVFEKNNLNLNQNFHENYIWKKKHVFANNFQSNQSINNFFQIQFVIIWNRDLCAVYINVKAGQHDLLVRGVNYEPSSQ